MVEYNIRNREKAREYNIAHWPQRKAKSIQRRSELVSMLGGKCSSCGYCDCEASLDFHHVVPGSKKFLISMPNMLREWKSVVEEAKKCVLLCANCHRKLHYEEGKN